MLIKIRRNMKTFNHWVGVLSMVNPLKEACFRIQTELVGFFIDAIRCLRIDYIPRQSIEISSITLRCSCV
jgi:hypothetical protein